MVGCYPRKGGLSKMRTHKDPLCIWRLKPLSHDQTDSWVDTSRSLVVTKHKNHANYWISVSWLSSKIGWHCVGWPISPLSTDCQHIGGKMATDCRPTISRLRITIDRLLVNSSVNSRSTVSWQSTDATYNTRDPSHFLYCYLKPYFYPHYLQVLLLHADLSVSLVLC